MAGQAAYPQVSGLSNAGLNLNSGQTAALPNEAILSLNSAAAGGVPFAVLQSDLRIIGTLKALISGALETWHTVGAGGQPAFAAGFANGAIGSAAAGLQV